MNHDPAKIDEILRHAGVVSAGKITWFSEVDSTNNRLMQQRKNHDIHGEIHLTERQTAGRGRRGKTWRTAHSGGILMSVGWRLGDAKPSGLSLVSGLAVVAALRECGVESVGLKWPNDIMASGKKLGGVLTEISGGQGVIGIGINVADSPDDDDTDTAGNNTANAVNKNANDTVDDLPRTCLKSLGYDIDRDALAAALIIAHCRYLTRFCAAGFAQFVAEWNALNIHKDCAVWIQSPAESFAGIVRGVDADGALLLDANGNRRRLISGDASIRDKR